MPKFILQQVESSYLLELYRAHENQHTPTTGELAKAFAVKPASAVDVLNRLSEKKLVTKIGWGKFSLTPRGHAVALRVIHNHRILETFFHKELGLETDKACIEASRIDYAIGDEVVIRLCQRLNNPSTCIHGKEVKHPRCAQK
ncbi:metal dependent repressor, DtxR family [Candidatus Caldarchaeum subterraneum]|uniref:Metal dependent repressor, DtxR family n=1 Tax=Caldiarchaeum subterraneum TaxID=311458 RepID=E6N7Y8_CALS0|nr:metal dependent repressor, DtxR family [Candidatus Caldarchaeum subterraneum]BAJ51179.1 metal dependent repressor, DtxR family [Candidatus Caldarchaeum subterraneum]